MRRGKWAVPLIGTTNKEETMAVWETGKGESFEGDAKLGRLWGRHGRRCEEIRFRLREKENRKQ